MFEEETQMNLKYKIIVCEGIFEEEPLNLNLILRGL